MIMDIDIEDFFNCFFNSLNSWVTKFNNLTRICHNYLGNEFVVSQIYLKDRVKAKIVAKDSAFIMIDIFDNVELEVESYDNAKVCINCYKGAKVKFKELDKSYIKVSYKLTKTYQ